MPHTLTHLPLDQLHTSKMNVRKHGPKAIDSLAASIRSIGLLQPLIVRQNGDGFKVVGGERRLKALEKIAREATPDASDAASEVPCIGNRYAGRCNRHRGKLGGECRAAADG